MADGPELFGDHQPTARVHLVGVLRQQPVAEHIPLKRSRVARTVVTVGDSEIHVAAYDELADKLATAAVRSAVEIEGVLIEKKWETGEGHKRSRLEVLATSVHVNGYRKHSPCSMNPATV